MAARWGWEVSCGGKEAINFWRIGISRGINGKEGFQIGGCSAGVLEWNAKLA